VAAVGSSISYSTMEDLMARIHEAGSPRARILYLDRVTDPRNMGAVLRSAAAFGVSGLIVPASESAPLNTAAVKASAGAALLIPVVRVGNPADTLDGMREMGYWIIGADGSAPKSFTETEWSRSVVLALGSEDRGLAADILAVCDEVVSIPMAAGFDSLNVSVAAAILMCAAFGAGPA
jgi:23S rRNA (guanosine2251-2'-O)-methyltransferase